MFGRSGGEEKSTLVFARNAGTGDEASVLGAGRSRFLDQDKKPMCNGVA